MVELCFTWLNHTARVYDKLYTETNKKMSLMQESNQLE